MSVNKVNKSNGQLIALASGNRMWVGTHAAHLEAIANGTMPNNCIVAETDVSEFPTTEDIIEANALTNLGTAANATQQTINGAIDSKVGNVNNSLNSLELSVASLGTKDIELGDKINSIEDDIDALETVDASLQRQITTLNGLKLSYTTVYASGYRFYTTIEGRYCDWVAGDINQPVIPSGYIAVRYFVDTKESTNGTVVAFPVYNNTSSGVPNNVGIITDGQVTSVLLRLGAVCVKLDK